MGVLKPGSGKAIIDSAESGKAGKNLRRRLELVNDGLYTAITNYMPLKQYCMERR
jgi:ABC-type Na+ transport system ATPase subunit NatA